VKRAQELGFTLREVKELLDLQSKRKITGAQVEEKAQVKIQEIRQKIADLKQMETSLLRLAKVCGEGEQAIRECKVFDCFEKGC
jgi:MerR family mercuric resistance operon transcriptional regulator